MSEETGVIVRTAEHIAAEIVAIKTETFRFLETATTFATRQSFEIGNKLIEAKKLVDPGKWVTWLKESVEYSEDTAQNLMRIAREYDSENPVIQTMSYSQLVAMFPLPAAEREEFLVDNDVGSLSAREIKKIIKDKEIAEKKAKNLFKIEKDLEKKKNEIEKLSTELAAAKKTAERDRSTAFRVTEEVNDLRKKLKELKDAPPKVEKVVEKVPGEVTEEQIQAIRDEVRAEFEVLLDEQAKDKMRQDPLAVEANVLFVQLQQNLEQLCNCLDKMESEQSEKFKTALSGAVRSFLTGRFGVVF